MPLFIPSPPISSFQLGPLTIHFYALCLLTGIAVGWTVGKRRWIERGGTGDQFEQIILPAVVVGVLGARVYHVLTHLGDYFGPNATQRWWAIWEGGLAIYGAVGFGALTVLFMARRLGLRFSSFGDSVAPGIIFAQGIGRFGNWFNQELYGWPTTLPWAVEIDPEHRLPGYEQYATFHPTFLYEMLWDFSVGFFLLWADRRFRLGRGKVIALYIGLYGFGRFFTEGMRLDYSYDTFGPIRFNQMAALLLFIFGMVLFAWLVKYRPGREPSVYLPGREPAVEATDDADSTTVTSPGSADRSDDDPEQSDPARDGPGDSESPHEESEEPTDDDAKVAGAKAAKPKKK